MGLRLVGRELGGGPGDIVVERLAVNARGDGVAVAHRGHRGEAHHRHLRRGKRRGVCVACAWRVRGVCVMCIVACAMWRVPCGVCHVACGVHVACAYLVAELRHREVKVEKHVEIEAQHAVARAAHLVRVRVRGRGRARARARARARVGVRARVRTRVRAEALHPAILEPGEDVMLVGATGVEVACALR